LLKAPDGQQETERRFQSKRLNPSPLSPHIIMLRWIIRLVVIGFASKLVNNYFQSRSERVRR
jgi:hypothetical protein